MQAAPQQNLTIEGACWHCAAGSLHTCLLPKCRLLGACQRRTTACSAACAEPARACGCMSQSMLGSCHVARVRCMHARSQSCCAFAASHCWHYRLHARCQARAALSHSACAGSGSKRHLVQLSSRNIAGGMQLSSATAAPSAGPFGRPPSDGPFGRPASAGKPAAQAQPFGSQPSPAAFGRPASTPGGCSCWRATRCRRLAAAVVHLPVDKSVRAVEPLFGPRARRSSDGAPLLAGAQASGVRSAHACICRHLQGRPFTAG